MFHFNITFINFEKLIISISHEQQRQQQSQQQQKQRHDNNNNIFGVLTIHEYLLGDCQLRPAWNDLAHVLWDRKEVIVEVCQASEVPGVHGPVDDEVDTSPHAGAGVGGVLSEGRWSVEVQDWWMFPEK